MRCASGAWCFHTQECEREEADELLQEFEAAHRVLSRQRTKEELQVGDVDDFEPEGPTKQVMLTELAEERVALEVTRALLVENQAACYWAAPLAHLEAPLRRTDPRPRELPPRLRASAGRRPQPGSLTLPPFVGPQERVRRRARKRLRRRCVRPGEVMCSSGSAG